MLPSLLILPKKSNNKAFTIVELLIAVSIFSVVSIAIYSTFNSGFSVLRRIKEGEFLEQKIIIKSENLARQLREQPASKNQLFYGRNTSIAFAANVDHIPCRLTYYLQGDSLKRVTDRLNQIITKTGKIDPQLKAKPVTFLSGLNKINFSYLYFDSNANRYIWTDTWTQDFDPKAVKFIINSQNNKEYAWIVFLPKT